MNWNTWRRMPNDLFEQMRHEMDQVFQRVMGDRPGGRNSGNAWMPSIDVEEFDREIVLKVDLPGVDAQHVDISIADGSLIIQGERVERREDTTQCHCSERVMGRFYRSIPLPPGGDPDKIVASSAKGVLTIVVPKKPEVQPKKVHVRSQD